jgi:hypothetical protein
MSRFVQVLQTRPGLLANLVMGTIFCSACRLTSNTAPASAPRSVTRRVKAPLQVRRAESGGACRWYRHERSSAIGSARRDYSGSSL